MDDLKVNKQTITFSGVGAHHQNGVAERCIQTITRSARAMLLHSVLMWPDEADLALWPFAMSHALYLWNMIPHRDSRLSPEEQFSRTKTTEYTRLQRLHVFGCPVYVLDPALQDGKKIPKWNPRARRGQFLGYSSSHSSLIGLIRNLNTGYVSPQYHCVYDDQFTTVPNHESGGILHEEPFDQQRWLELVRAGWERAVLDDDDDPETGEPPNSTRPPTLAPVWKPEPVQQAPVAPKRVRFQIEPTVTEPEVPLSPEGDNTNEEDIVPETAEPLIDEAIPDEPPTPQPPPAPNEPEPEEGVQRTRFGRVLKQPDRLTYKMAAFKEFEKQSNPYCNPKRKVLSSQLNEQFLMGLKWNQAINAIKSNDLQSMMNLMSQHTDVDDGTVEWMHPMILAAQANSADNPTWNEAMSGPDKDGYWKAMELEVDTLEQTQDTWDIVDRKDWMNVLPSTWAFKCKRYPDGSVRKLKARFCARGDKQIEGVDYFDTFAPVVNWTTVRLMLILSLILNLSTAQVDYTAAFVHAPIDKNPEWDNMTEEEREKSGVYVQMPRGFTQPGKVLKLKKSLYGLRQSPRNFFQYLKSKLESCGFESNDDVDPCLFVSDKVIALVYVDDTLLFSPKPEYIEEAMAELSASGLELQVEDSVAGFLGVHIDRSEVDGSIKLTQSGLIKRIVDALDVGHLDKVMTPAAGKPLVKDEFGDPPEGKYSYASVVGMLQYLQGHSRPDITYAVSQCARFVHSPRRSHEIALERIGRYLKGTMNEGLILRPSDELDIDCYVDSDFAGLWPHEDKLDPVCVKSRTGFVIFIAQCPVIWMSRLQGEIATSTQESEYIALSTAMRSVLPFQRAAKHIATWAWTD